MNEPNPYQSPAAEAEIIQNPYAQRATSGQGIWRMNDKLIMHKSAQLPNICLKTNQPAERRVRKTLSWHPPALAVLVIISLPIYVIVALIMTKKATIEIPVTNDWMAIRRKRMLTSVAVLLLGVVMFIGGIFSLSVEILPDELVVALIIAGIGVGVGGLVAWVMTARIVWPARITDTHVHLSGVDRTLLGQFPLWPGD